MWLLLLSLKCDNIINKLRRSYNLKRLVVVVVVV